MMLKTTLLRGVLPLFLVLAALPALRAQEEQPKVDLAELIRQIRRNMIEVEKDIDRAQAESAKAAAEEARKNLEKLTLDMRGRGEQITKDIDEFIKNLPP